MSTYITILLFLFGTIGVGFGSIAIAGYFLKSRQKSPEHIRLVDRINRLQYKFLNTQNNLKFDFLKKLYICLEQIYSINGIDILENTEKDIFLKKYIIQEDVEFLQTLEKAIKSSKSISSEEATVYFYNLELILEKLLKSI